MEDKIPTEGRQTALGVRQELERGMRFSHVMMTVNQEQANEAVAYVQALADLLVQKGLIAAEEMEAPLESARREIEKLEMPRVRLADMGDKYTDGKGIDIDCASRIALCQGRCCTFRFFLTRQDVEEGIARWDYGNPYWIKQNGNGYCIHSEPATRACMIHAQRPHVCRQYDCRRDKRVWLDYERGIPAPALEALGDAPIAMAEIAMLNSMRNQDERAVSQTQDNSAPASDQAGELVAQDK